MEIYYISAAANIINLPRRSVCIADVMDVSYRTAFERDVLDIVDFYRISSGLFGKNNPVIPFDKPADDLR